MTAKPDAAAVLLQRLHATRAMNYDARVTLSQLETQAVITLVRTTRAINKSLAMTSPTLRPIVDALAVADRRFGEAQDA